MLDLIKVSPKLFKHYVIDHFKYKTPIFIHVVMLSMVLIMNLIDSWPYLIYKFVDYPELSQATIVEGTLKVTKKVTSGGRSGGGGGELIYDWIIDASGEKHHMFTGVYPKKKSVIGRSELEGMHVKAWLHPTFGLLQGEFVKPPKLSAFCKKRWPLNKHQDYVDNMNMQIFVLDEFTYDYDWLKSEAMEFKSKLLNKKDYPRFSTSWDIWIILIESFVLLSLFFESKKE